MKNSIKQLFRMPIISALFCALFAIASFFLCCGINVWARNEATIDHYEDAFVTIATIRQTPIALEQVQDWNDATQSYFNYTRETFGPSISKSALEIDGLNYIFEPEKRPYYGAFMPDYLSYASSQNENMNIIVEVSPIEDSVANTLIELKVINVLFGNPNMEKTIWFQDDVSDNPIVLYATKTYIISLAIGFADNDTSLATYFPSNFAPYTTQYQKNGDRASVHWDNKGDFVEEITESFYATPSGERWMELVYSLQRLEQTIPILPTNNTDLLVPFFTGQATIVEGQDISKQEYYKGERVCLIQQEFAKMNGLSVGDTIEIQLYFADYWKAPIDSFHFGTVGVYPYFGLLNANGKAYSVFSDHDYIIKGIYVSEETYLSSVGMGYNTIVIPMSSVQETDENNIAVMGPMVDNTTSFSIPNGSINEFMAIWEKYGNSQLEITFYDRGYSQLQRGVENMNKMSSMFLIVGFSMSLALVFFFCNIFITKQKIRTIIERMLGMKKHQCKKSLLSGFLLFAISAIVIGCFVGSITSKILTDNMPSEDYYSRDYSFGLERVDNVEIETQNVSVLYSVLAGSFLITVTFFISSVYADNILKHEPLEMLGM